MPARSPSPSRAQTAQRQGQVQERRLSPMVVSTAKGLLSPWSLLRALSETDGGLGEIRRPGQADLPAGIDGEQVRGVAVGVVGIVAVGLPFLELAPFADLVRGQMRLHVGDLRLVVGVHAQRPGRVEVVLEQVPDDLLVVHHAVLARAVFRRPAVGGDQACRPADASDGLPSTGRFP